MGQRPILKPRCAHCRKRKIKCDYERPRCGNCEKTNKECIYVNGLTIVSYEPERRASGSSVKNKRPTGQEPQAVQLQQQPPIEQQFAANIVAWANATPDSSDDNESWRDRRLAIAARRSGVSPPAVSLQNAALLDGARDRFVEKFLPIDRATWKLAEGWLDSWRKLSEAHQVVSMTARSLYVQTMAQELRDTAKYRAALQMAAESYRLLSTHLAEAKTLESKRAAFAASATMLMTDAVLVGAPEHLPRGPHEVTHAWLTHVPGITSCILALGPKAFQEPDLQKLFNVIRSVLAFAAIYQRKPSFLASQEWKTIPYENTEKDYFVEIMDMFLRIPILFNLTAKFIAATDPRDRETAIEEYMVLAREAEADSEAWLAKVQASTGFRIDLRHCPGILLFALPRLTLRAGIGILFYHSIQLLLHLVAANIWNSGVEIPERHRDFISRLADTQSMLPVARVVTMSASFCGSPQHGILGKANITPSVIIAKGFYDTVQDPQHKQPFYELGKRFYNEGYLRLAEYAGYGKTDEPLLRPWHTRRSSPGQYVQITRA